MLGKTACQYLLEETEHQDTVVNMLLQNKKNQSQELKPVRSWKWAIDIYIYKARGSDSGFCIHRTGPMNQNETKPRFISFLEILVRDSVGCGPHDVVCLLFFFFLLTRCVFNQASVIHFKSDTTLVSQQLQSIVCGKDTPPSFCGNIKQHTQINASIMISIHQVCFEVRHREVTRYV